LVAAMSGMAALASRDILADVSVLAAIFADTQAAATLIGALVGFAGVALTLLLNARLQRNQYADQKEDDARGIAAALKGEAENMFRSINTRVELALENVLSDPGLWMSSSDPLPTPVFQATAARIGSLGTQLAGRVSQSFGHYHVMFGQLFSNRDQLEPGDELGWAVLWVPSAENVARLIIELHRRAAGDEPFPPSSLKIKVAELLAEKLAQPPGTTWLEVQERIDREMTAARAADPSSRRRG